MFRFAVPAVAALGLIAAAAQSQTSRAGAGAEAAPPMGWHLSREGSMAKLAFGVANSDQLALMITCEPGAAAAVVYGEVRPESPRLVRTSGPAPIDPLSGGLFEESRMPLRDPALRTLARRGVLPVEGEGGRFELTASAAERHLVGLFLSHCGTDTV